MPCRASVLTLLTLSIVCHAAATSAQEAARTWIQSVTVDVSAGTLTISGTGFSEASEVTLDGHSLTVLPGTSATRLVVVVPAAVLSMPGTYRLTVMDPARRVGDAFEVSATGPWQVTARSERSDASAPPTAPALRNGANQAQVFALPPGDGVNARLTENAGQPYATKVGYEALLSVTGFYDTAVGYRAQRGNTAGAFNTAIGADALYVNAGGSYNTAVGFYSMRNLTDTSYDTAVGSHALYRVMTGRANTALGAYAGSALTDGDSNIFIGSDVAGLADDNHTLRIGYPYKTTPLPGGQNRAFIAGIRGTSVSGATPVGVNADGQLGMATVLGAGAGFGCATCYQAGTLELYNPGTGDLNIQSGPSYRAMLNPNGGNVGVGVSALFGAGAGFGCSSCYQAGYVQFYNPATGQLTLQSGAAFDTLLNPYGGNVGIGVADAVYPLQMASGAHVTAGGVWTNASSRALKDHITPMTLERAQEALLALAPVEYTYKADPTQHHVGFIAEDVPALVAQNDRASLSPMDLVAVLTKVVQAQQAQLAAQQTRQAEQERAIAALQAELARLGAIR